MCRDEAVVEREEEAWAALESSLRSLGAGLSEDRHVDVLRAMILWGYRFHELACVYGLEGADVVFLLQGMASPR
jgi:hypothetical protein